VKRRSLILSLLGTTVLGSAGVTHAQDKTLVVGCDTEFRPFEFKQDGKYVGVDIDLWAEIAKNLNLKYTLEPVDFTGLIPGLQTHNIDVALSGLIITEARKKVIDYSDPYYTSGLAAMARIDDAKINSLDDLNGKTIATKAGTATVDWIKEHFKSAQTHQFPNIDQAYMALMAGRVDGAMHDTPNVQYYALTVGKGKVKILSPLVSGEQYGIGFTKGSPLVAKVNTELARMKADGRLAQILKKWLGEQTPQP
jgi:glutamine transport system substrate-binding protein